MPDKQLDKRNNKLKNEAEELNDDEMVIAVAEYIFMITGVDERVHMNEYRLIKPLMNAAFGKNCPYAETEAFISKNGFSEEETRERFRDVLDELKVSDPELRYRMITLAMYIAAIDEDISKREKSYIESLF